MSYEGVVDSLGEPVADLTLTHGDGGFEGHGGSLVGSGFFFMKENATDLRAIAMGDDDVIFLGKFSNDSAGLFGDFFLSGGGSFTVFLEGVATEC